MIKLTVRASLVVACLAAVTMSGCGPNLAEGRAYTLEPPPSEKYPDTGLLLTDGLRASADDLHEGWVGFEAGKPTVTLDLEDVYTVERVKVGFLSYSEFGIETPTSVEVLVSLDGLDWETAGWFGSSETDWSMFDLKIPATKARYVRCVLERDGWAFIDEIEVFGSGIRGRKEPVEAPEEDNPTECD